jgi:murein DD-endopeptidase MepM/ murein hydrolase activator NlpD
LLNAPVGVQRVKGRLRRAPTHRPSPQLGPDGLDGSVVTRTSGGIRSLAVAAGLLPDHARRRLTVPSTARPIGRGLVERVGPDRLVAVAVAVIVLVASAVSVVPGPSGEQVTAGAPDGVGWPVGGPSGPGRGPRIAIGGAVDASRPDVTYVDMGRPAAAGVASRLQSEDAEVIAEGAVVQGPFLEDGTLLKPVAVNTTVADASGLLRSHTVASGDTLTGIAKKYGVSMMTVWWANKLTSKDLKNGQVLVIPPVNGLVVTVAVGDTLESLAAKHKVDGEDILAANELTDPSLVVGQVLLMPGAKGKPLPTPKPTPRPIVRTRTTTTTVKGPSTYNGGSFSWPVSGGDISQYYHYGHYGIDIAADHGTRVKAAGGGTVIFAGWKSNGGGYQVWIAHGSNLYTTYNHMSAVTVGVGQGVDRGQQVGRVGQSGYATGPHLHFEVWIGKVWDGGRRVNPLGYL